MTVQISAVTIGVEDLKRSKQFYEGLGCRVDQDHPGFVSFKMGDGSTSLSLYARSALAADAGVDQDGSGFTGVVFSYIVAAAEQVDEVLAKAERGGGTVVRPAQSAQWGGYFGHFSDPDGYLWKVASS